MRTIWRFSRAIVSRVRRIAFEREPDFGERRLQIVGDPGQHQRAVGVLRGQARRHRIERTRDQRDLGVAAIGALLKPLNAAIVALVFAGALRFALLSLSLHGWRDWVAGFVAVEFAYYWFDRWSPTVTLL